MSKHHTTPEEKAAAIARVRLGESTRAVAESVGVSHTTIASWVERAELAETDQEKAIAANAEELAEQIQALTRTLRHELLEAIQIVIPTAVKRGSLQALATTYGILSDKDLKFREAEAAAQTKGEAEALHDIPDDDLEAELQALVRAEQEGAEAPAAAGEGAPAQ